MGRFLEFVEIPSEGMTRAGLPAGGGAPRGAGMTHLNTDPYDDGK